MGVVGTGQISLIDLNDVIASATQPANPVDGTLWWNTTERKLYVYSTITGWKFAGDGIVYGGRNLIYNSNGTILTSSGSPDGWTSGIVSDTQNGKPCVRIDNSSTTAEVTKGSKWFTVKPSTQYTLRLLVKQTANMANFDVWFLSRKTGSTMAQGSGYDYTNMLVNAKTASTSGFTEFVVTWTTKSDDMDGFIRIDNNKSTDGAMSNLWIAELKVESGNVATDWTPAYEDDDSRITNIQITLGNIANDGVIEITERQYIKDKLTEILGFPIANATKTMPTATTLDSGSTTDNGKSVSTKGSFYTSRKSALNAGIPSNDATYVDLATQYGNLKTYLDGLTPIDAWDVSSANSNIAISVVKDTWRTNWANYYLAEQALDTATAKKLKDNVDNVTVGGKNLLRNTGLDLDTSYHSPSANVTRDTITKDENTNTWKFAVTGLSSDSWRADNPAQIACKAGDIVSASVDIYIPTGHGIDMSQPTLEIQWFDSGGTRIGTNTKGSSLTLLDQWQRLKLENITAPANAVKMNARVWLQRNGSFWSARLKLESGTKATDWTPALYDTDSKVYDVVFNVNKQNIVTTVTSSSDFNTALAQGAGDFVFNNGGASWKSNHALTTALAGTKVQDAKYGAYSFQITNETYGFFGTPIPINTDRIYKVKFRVKQTVDPTTAGKSNVYAGVASFDQNKNPLTTSTYGTHRYCAVVGKSITATNGWQEFEGLISGEGNEGYTQFITGTKYAVPMFIVNYSGGNGTALVDICSLEDVTDTKALTNQINSLQQTISADGITTVIQSSTFYDDYTKALDGKADTDALGSYATQDSLDNTNKNISDLNSKVDGIDLTKYATTQYVDETSTSLTRKFSASGGMNLLKNSIGFSDFTFWTKSGANVKISTIADNELNTLGFGSGFQFDSDTVAGRFIYQDIPVIPNQTYTLSWYAKKINSATGTGNDNSFVVQALDTSNNNIKSTWYYNTDTTGGVYKANQMTFTPTTSTLRIRIYGYQYAVAWITGLMLTIGDVALQWSLAIGEVYNTNVRMDINGIRVSQIKTLGDGSKVEIGYTTINPNEFAGWYDVDGSGTFEKIFYLNGDETVSKKVRALDEINMGNIKILRVNSANNTGWAFTAT